MNKPPTFHSPFPERIDIALTNALTAHANWCRTGAARASAKALMVALTGKEVVRVTPIEETIEANIAKMAARNIDAADVLRMEYGAGWQGVMKRRGTLKKMRTFLWVESTPKERAKAVGMDLTLYSAYLSNARSALYEVLIK